MEGRKLTRKVHREANVAPNPFLDPSVYGAMEAARQWLLPHGSSLESEENDDQPPGGFWELRQRVLRRARRPTRLSLPDALVSVASASGVVRLCRPRGNDGAAPHFISALVTAEPEVNEGANSRCLGYGEAGGGVRGGAK